MDKDSRNKLVLENLPLVGYLVSEICAKATHLSRDDMASVGAIALITSADSFNPDLGIPFGAFARRRIVGAFADEMRASDWASRSARKRIKDTLAVQETLTGVLGRNPTTDEISAALGVEREVADAALSDAARTVTSLDDSMGEYLAADQENPEESLLANERIRFLRTAVEVLPEKMRYIVEQIYFEGRAVKDLAAELGTTHSAISQQRSEAMALMREGMSVHYSDTEKSVPFVPPARIGVNRRKTYLSALAEGTAHGITRGMHPFKPALAGAV